MEHSTLIRADSRLTVCGSIQGNWTAAGIIERAAADTFFSTTDRITLVPGAAAQLYLATKRRAETLEIEKLQIRPP
jgi:hypothetical protein